MALFERCWAQLDGSNIGQVNTMTAAAFLMKSQLKEPTLHKIWDLADAGGRGYLDKQGFFTALRLVAACQMGREPALSNILPMDPPPKFVGLESTKWTIEAAERTLYNNNFERLKPINGLLSGDKVRPILMKSQLPIDMLGKIWAMSDIDRDGSLDADEFAVAMKFTTLIKQGEVLPLQLPTSMVPQAKAARLGLAPPTVTTTLTGPRPTSPVAQSDSDWVITPDMKARYDSYFVGVDKDHDGLVSGEEARGLFMASNLSQQVLAHIWNLCDIERSGKLNSEQFVLAMYFMAERVRGREPPDKLPQHLIPPTKRRPAPQQQAPPSPLLSSSFDHPPSRDDKHTPLLLSSGSASDLGLSSSSLLPPTGLLQPTPSSSSSNQPGFMADFTAIKELDTVSTDIENVKKEKVQLQADILQKQEMVKQRKNEMATLHGELNSTSHQRELLEKQKKNGAQTEVDNIVSEDELMTGCGDGRFMGRWYGAPTIVSTSAAPINCQDHNKVSAAVVSPPVSNEFQKLVQEKEALIQQSVLQQYEIKRLTEELQKDKRDQEAVLSEQKRMMSQRQEQFTAEKQDILTQLRQKTLESQQLQEENTYLQQYNTRLRDEKDEEIAEEINHLLKKLHLQLQSGLEQQPELGDDLDINFWLVSHSELNFTSQVLGRGSYGSVTVGSFRGQSVAVKELHSCIRSPYYDKLLRREISLMAKIRHPNLLLFIAAVLDKPGHSDPIIITELLDTDLRSAYQDGKLANNRVRLFILRDVAAALNYLHLQREPIVHRDVSSANVLLQALPDNKWRGKLSDFGSANIVQYASTAGPGNRQYTAPEVLRGEKQSTKMDVYSYGMLFCEIFTNQFPDPEAFPYMLDSMVHSWPLMHRIVSSCIEHDPIKRPTMNSIVDQLNTFTK